MALPQIIQGGMGVGVSNWCLAHAVGKLGQLGVISGTALPIVLARRLQQGDFGGHMRRAIAHFPFPQIAQRVMDRYYIEGGKPAKQPFRLSPMPGIEFSQPLLELTVLGNFTEVFLAKEGHAGVIGINYLEKIQVATLSSLWGAMLAGVDYIMMGAGIPRSIPGVMDAFAAGKAGELRIDVAGAAADEAFHSRFDPTEFCGTPAPTLKRPRFYAIVSSSTLAMTLARKSNGKVDGFIVEGATAGGHNAPPRGPLQLTPQGEPIYGERDVPDLDKIRDLGLPFYLAGSYGRPGRLNDALALGASGVQVGTAFAFCDESGIAPALKQQIIALSLAGKARVHTDASASPTGFPFKVLQAEGSVSDAATYQPRPRLCDLGYLRQAYQRDDMTVGFRCPAEPVADFVRKGGEASAAQGRKCLCNSLISTIGLGQTNGQGYIEPPLLTAGDDVATVCQFLAPGTTTYSAADVLRQLLPAIPAPVVSVPPSAAAANNPTSPAVA